MEITNPITQHLQDQTAAAHDLTSKMWIVNIGESDTEEYADGLEWVY